MLGIAVPLPIYVLMHARELSMYVVSEVPCSNQRYRHFSPIRSRSALENWAVPLSFICKVMYVVGIIVFFH